MCIGYSNGLGLLVLVASGLMVSCKSGGSLEGEIPPPRQPRAMRMAEARKNVNHEVKIGEQLEVFVTEDASFNGVYPVREKGDIIIPRVGRIVVAGLSVKEAETQVKKKLEQGQLAKASVIVDRVNTVGPDGAVAGVAGSPVDNKILVYMTGKVAQPGQHRIAVPEGRTLGIYEAMLISGGMSQFGDPRKVHILRAGEGGKRVRVNVDVKKIMDGELADMPIGEGDVVVVPEKVFGF